MRHFAYHPAASLDDLTSYTAIDDSLDPPDDALPLTAPAYGDMLNQRDKPSELDWARDKSIWFIGDSCVSPSLFLIASPRMHSRD